MILSNKKEYLKCFQIMKLEELSHRDWKNIGWIDAYLTFIYKQYVFKINERYGSFLLIYKNKNHEVRFEHWEHFKNRIDRTDLLIENNHSFYHGPAENIKEKYSKNFYWKNKKLL